MKPLILIMNFTRVYEQESFLQNKAFEWIDCTGISGTNCFCDPEAEKILKRKIVHYSPEGIHFIDSGNYHYISKLWTDKVGQPFSLVVFDHHPDMQAGSFENILSCGSWVKEVLDSNPFVRKVFIVGASEKLINTVDDHYRGRLVFYSDQALDHEGEWNRLAEEHLNEPVYISIDKDVLDPKSAGTNWDQGSLSLFELEKLLAIILRKEQVIGVDICGECSTTLSLFEWKENEALNNTANKELVNLFTSMRSLQKCEV